MHKLLDWLYHRFNYFLLVLWVLSAAEMICIKFNFGFPILSEASSSLLYDLCLSFFAADLFYMLVVYLPEKRNSRYRKMSAYHFVFRICYDIDRIERGITRNDVSRQVSAAAWQKYYSGPMFRVWLKIVRDYYERLNVLRQFIDARTMLKLDNIMMLFQDVEEAGSLFKANRISASNAKLMREIFAEVKEIKSVDKSAFDLVKERYANLSDKEDTE